MSSEYPIRAVSQLTGLGLDTLRAWERRYQAVVPYRGERGRLYREEDIRRLRLLRSATEAGHAIGQIARLSDAELERLQSRAAPAPAPVFAEASPVQTLLEAVSRYDTQTLEAELGRLALLLRPTDLVHGVVLPLMREVGSRWETGRFRIAQEHLLSGCVRSLLGALVRRQNTRNSRGKILLATPRGELHEFGILAAAMLAVEQRYEAVYLGASLPAEEILHAAHALAPRVVVLAVMEPNATPATRDEVLRVGRELGAASELWLGGSGAASIAGAASQRLAVVDTLVTFERFLERLL